MLTQGQINGPMRFKRVPRKRLIQLWQLDIGHKKFRIQLENDRLNTNGTGITISKLLYSFYIKMINPNVTKSKLQRY